MTMYVDGVPSLQRRLAAISGTKFGRPLMQQVGLVAVREAKALVPRKTANLARSIRVGHVSDEGVEVVAGGQRQVGYAAHVEFGTRPHVIRPRQRRFLRFPAQGTPVRLTGSARTRKGKPVGPMVYARKVNHPGTRPQPYLVPGAKAALAKVGLERLIVSAWNRAA